MDKRKDRRRWVERGKTALIVLLAVSACYLALRSQVFGTLPSPFGGGGAVAGRPAEEDSADLARPVRMAVMNETGRRGAQYDTAETDTLFSRTAGLLSEALGNAGEPLQVDRAAWEQALSAAPGVYFDFLGQLPLSALQVWLGSGVSGGALTGSARRLLLTVGEDGSVLLYYHNEEDGLYYASAVEVLGESRLRSAASGVQGNGALFAFEEEEYAHLDPDTMLLPEAPETPAYQGSSPLEGDAGTAVRGQLAESLSFPNQDSAMYQASDGSTVIKNGLDTLRLKPDGTVTFTSASAESPRFPVLAASPEADQPDRADRVRTACSLASQLVLPYAGEGRLFLREVRDRSDGSTEVLFGYCLSGAEVRLEGGADAACFVLSEDRVVSFSLVLRTYGDMGDRTAALPEQQAQAAMLALGAEGAELRLCYQDSVTEPVTALWIAA